MRSSYKLSFLSNVLMVVMFIVFLTERLDEFIKLFFFYLYPNRILFIVLLFCVNVNWMYRVSKQTAFIFKMIYGFIAMLLISTLLSENLFFSLKKWIDISTSLLFIILIYSFLSKYFSAFSPLQIYDLFYKSYKKIIIICFLGGLFFRFNEMRSVFGLNFQRVSSFFKDPNFYCSFLLLAFFIVYYSNDKKINKAIFLSLIIISIITTGSKGGLFSLLACFMIKQILSVRYLFFRKIFLYVPIVFGLIILCFILLNPIIALEYYTSKISPFFGNMGGDSMLPRMLVWAGGAQDFLSNFLFGLGPGSTIFSNKSENITDAISVVSNLGYHGLSADILDKLAIHSFYLEILFENGTIPFVFFLIYISRFLKSVYAQIDKRNFSVFNGFFYGFIAYLISLFTLSYNPYFINFIIGFVLFLLDRGKCKVNVSHLKNESLNTCLS